MQVQEPPCPLNVRAKVETALPSPEKGRQRVPAQCTSARLRLRRIRLQHALRSVPRASSRAIAGCHMPPRL